MRCGAEVTVEHHSVLRKALDQIDMYAEADEQMRKAIDSYLNDGSEWSFGDDLRTL